MPSRDATAAVSCVVIAGGSPAEVGETLGGLAAQTLAVRDSLVVRPAGHPSAGTIENAVREVSSAGGRAAAMAQGIEQSAPAEWLWLLEPGTVPASDALERLLNPLEGLPPPVLLAGKVVDANGDLHPTSAPAPRAADQGLMIRAARHRLVALRSARYGSLLVRRAAVTAAGPPRERRFGEEGDVEWTARLLKAGVGYLVPGSVAVRRAPGGLAGSRPLRERLAMMGPDAWTRDERLWLGIGLATDLAGRARRLSPTD